MSALGDVAASESGPAATPEADIDRAVARLGEAAPEFVKLAPAHKAKLLGEVKRRLYELAPRLTLAGCNAKDIDPGGELYGEELLAGPVTILHYVRMLEQALTDVAAHGLPVIPDECVSERGSGSSVRVLPISALDRLRFAGISAEAWLDVPPQDVAASRAATYRGPPRNPEVGLVLGAGNIPAIPATDALHELFVAGRTCLLKMSPVNAYLGPLFELVFAPLVSRGYLAFVYGGPEVGAYCCQHPGIAAIHVTGSAETHDRIVWGSEPERSERKRLGQPICTKQVTSELGNITPVIVPPGKYAERELEHLSRSIAGMMTHNASFNCLSAKMLVLPGDPAFRADLLARLGRRLESVVTRKAYYPGAKQRYQRFVAASATVREIGSGDGERLPWALITGLDPASATLHFEQEPFCSVLSEVSLPEREPVEFFAAATRFANERLWGTLSAVVIAPQSLLGDSRLKEACDAAIERLDYGAVSLNAWSGLAFGISELPWGAAPGSTRENVRSGIGWSHNAFMLERVRKVVVRAPLAAFPTPFWYPEHRSLGRFAQAFFEYELEPSALRLAKLAGAAF